MSGTGILAAGPGGAAARRRSRAARERTLALTGDVMLGRAVNAVLPSRPVEAVWGDTLPVLRSADARLINLECVISDRGRPWHPFTKAFHFRAAPRAMDVLQAAGIDCVSLANNHILDYGVAAMLDCLERLDAAGVAHAGAGAHLSTAARLALLQVAGLTVGVVSCTDNMPAWAATDERPGVHFVQPGQRTSEAALLRHLETVRSQVDLLVLSVHWGPNMTTRPAYDCIRLAHRAVAAGVDIVHGHSSHVFHGIEVHQGRPILYDTGDFVDDYAVDSQLRNDWTFLYLVRLADAAPVEIRAVPCVIEDRRVRLAQSEASLLLGRLERRCAEFHTRCEAGPRQLTIPLA